MFDLFQLPKADSRLQNSHVSRGVGIVRSHRKVTHDTHEIVISCDENFRFTNAEAGQFAVLKFPSINRPRPYSFARNPRSAPLSESTFFIREVPNGEVSDWLKSGDRTGSKIDIAGPIGKFTLDDRSGPLVCIAGGSGMSAILSLIEYAAELQVERDCHFYYGARSQRDLYCELEIENVTKLWSKDNKFVFIPVLSEEPSMSDWGGLRGLVTEVLLSDMELDSDINFGLASYFLCGPPPMIKAAFSAVKKIGVSSENIFQDNFEDIRSATPVIDNHRCVLCDECLLVKPIDHCIVELAELDSMRNNQGRHYKVVESGSTSGLYYNSLYIDESKCIRCFACVDACPHDAISRKYSIRDSLRQKSYD